MIWQTSQQERDTRAGGEVELMSESVPPNKLSFTPSKMKNLWRLSRRGLT